MKKVLFCLFSLSAIFQSLAEGHLVIGTHVTEEHNGLYLFSVDEKSGQIQKTKFVDELGTSVIARTLKDQVAYLCGALRDPKKGQIVAIDLKSQNVLSKHSSFGAKPCYVTLSHDKRFLFVANIQGGTVCSFALDEKGGIKELRTQLKIQGGKRPFKPHAAVLSPDGRFLFVPDISGQLLHRLKVDKQRGTLEEDGVMSSDNFKAPRHFLFDQEGRTAYLVNQTGESVTVFRYAPKTGELAELGNVQSLPDDQLHINNHIAEIKIHPSGKFVYVSNRGHNSLALYNRNTETGDLTFVKCFESQGEAPWSFALNKLGTFIYCTNRKSNNLVVFKVDLDNGFLSYTGQKFSVTAPSSIYLFEN